MFQEKNIMESDSILCKPWPGGQKTGFAYFKDLRRIEERISNLQQRKGKNGASWG
jgi:hypothetical protein